MRGRINKIKDEKVTQKIIPQMNLKGAMGLIKKSKYPLAPLYEALTNALEAIAQRSLVEEFSAEITISLRFRGLIEEVKELEEIEIVDNGAGFNDENYRRYIEFFDTSKGYDNRGTGRLQLLHRFDCVRVESAYRSPGEGVQYRQFTCDKNSFLTPSQSVETEGLNTPYTKVTLSQFSSDVSEKTFYDALTIEDIFNDIKRLFLLRFYLESQSEKSAVPRVNIKFYKNGDLLDESALTTESFPQPVDIGEVNVPYMRLVLPSSGRPRWVKVEGKAERIKWAHFKLPAASLAQNGVYLCSKDIPVQEIKFDKIKKSESIKGSRYMTAFYGDVLNDPGYVSHAVDAFNFPEKKEVEKKIEDLYFDDQTEYLLLDSITEAVNSVMPKIYEEVMTLSAEHEVNVKRIAKAHGISEAIAMKATIGLGDSEQAITKKVYSAQAEYLAEKGYEVKKLYESLNALNPTDLSYGDSLHKKVVELSELVDEQNKEELSRYIIRREMVAEVLRKMLAGELLYQGIGPQDGKRREKEGIFHDLIIKRKSTSKDGLNDLWVISEEFLHYEGCSELPISQIECGGRKLLRDISDEEVARLGLKPDRRPDIFLYAEEGKCVLIELKEPETDLSDHLNQMTKYCNLIANYSALKITRFYCYLIGEKINPVTDLSGEYEETVAGDWIRYNVPIKSFDANRNNIGTAQIEVIKLSSIHKRAHRRNLSFAEKLGLPDLLAAISKNS